MTTTVNLNLVWLGSDARREPYRLSIFFCERLSECESESVTSLVPCNLYYSYVGIRILSLSLFFFLIYSYVDCLSEPPYNWNQIQYINWKLGY